MRSALTSRRVIGAATLAALGLMQRAQADNLISNPGFEAGTGGTDIAAWTRIFNCQRANFDNVPQHLPGSSWNLWLRTFEPLGGGVTQTIGGIAGDTNYTLSGWNLFQDGYFQSDATVQMGLIWLDQNNNPTGTPAELDIDPNSMPQTNTWLPFSLPATAPHDATSVKVSLGWIGGQSAATQPQSAFLDDIDLQGIGTPPSGSTWNVNGGGDWNKPGSWFTGDIPHTVDAVANLGNIIQADSTVFSDVAITLGTLNYDNAHMYVVAGAGTLTMQVSSGSAQIIVAQAGTQKLNIPTIIASNTVLNVASGGNLIIADPVTINSGKTLTQTGTGGTVTYQSIVNVLGGAGIAFGNSTHAHELDIAATGTASIGGSGSVLTVDALANGGKLDVKNNSLVVAYGNGANPSSTIQSQLTSGYAGGAWNGIGINSSSATQRIGVGWKDDATSKSVIVKYTYDGDSNLDGVVNTADFNSLAQHFNATSTSAIWLNGDFNYDGKVNALDFNAVATNFGAAPIPATGLGTLVPEPTSVALLIPMTALVAAHRRRRRM